jgi:cysteine desulfurase
MIYLDYSATTPVDPRVLDCFVETSKNYPGNANSSHHLGEDAKRIIEESSERILSYFGDSTREVIYTSGATEANNLAIKGIAFKKKNIGMHLITSAFEHPSVTACFGYLQNLGFEVDFVDTDAQGRVDLSSLKRLLRSDTILVSIAQVNSEIGIIQPIDQIGQLLVNYPYVTFHSDMTQAVGKIPVQIEHVDLISFTAHKIYGPVGIGCLIRKPNIILETLIHGGRSTRDYRSGTPASALITAFSLALSYAKERLDRQYRYVFGLNHYVRERLSIDKKIVFNSEVDCCVPHILNLSVLSVEADALMKKLDDQGIIVSTQTACHTGGSRSESVYRLTGSDKRAKTSIRISLSHLSTRDEMDDLVEAIEREV